MAVVSEQYHRPTKDSNISNVNSPMLSGRKPSVEQQRKSTSRSSTGRARSTRGYRESIRSAVPETSIISMAKRPDQGGKGKHNR